jgi:hypothetical protein
MNAKVKATKDGKFQAVISNASFGFQKVFTFDTKTEAEAKVKAEKQNSQNRLSKVPTISEYFNIA